MELLRKGKFSINEITTLKSIGKDAKGQISLSSETQPISVGLDICVNEVSGDGKPNRFVIAQLVWDAHEPCVRLESVGDRMLTYIETDEWGVFRQLAKAAAEMVSAANADVPSWWANEGSSR